MRKTYSRTTIYRSIFWTVCFLWYWVLCQPSHSQVFTNLRNPKGSELKFRSPVGYSCDYNSGERPSISAYGGNTSFGYNYGESQSDVTGGVILTIPFGGGVGSQNCARFVEVELNSYKLERAKEMFMDGLITQEQLDAIVEKTYKTISE